MSSHPSLDQLRSHLSGKPLAKFEPCRRSDSKLSTVAFDDKEKPSAAGGSVIDLNLLSPPLSVGSLDAPPFKPADSDQTSLTMKNRRRRRSRCHRDGLDRASTGDAEERSKNPPHARKRLISTSVPDLRHHTIPQPFPSAAGQWLMRQQLQALHVAHRRDSIARSIGFRRRASLPQKPRRWTMPSKAASTRVLSEAPTPTRATTIVPSIDQGEHSLATAGTVGTSHPNLLPSPQAANHPSSSRASETPAMIILRRATKKVTSTTIRRTSLRPNAITSFPPPKFNRTTSTCLSSFFGLNPQRNHPPDDEPIQTSVRQSSWSTGQDPIDPLQKASVTADKVQLTANTIAAPAFTHVEILPISHFHARADQQDLHLAPLLSARRCSTTIVSGSSVHEIIWDENLTSSSEGSTSADVSRQTSQTAKRSKSRRQSVLVEKLEAQLRNHVPPRKASAAASSSQPSKASRTSSLDGNGRTASRLHRFAGWNRATLHEVDKSRRQAEAASHEPPRLNHGDAGAILASTLQDEGQLSPTAECVAFFPPLGEGSAGHSSSDSSQRSSLSSQQQSKHHGGKHVIIEEPWDTFPASAAHGPEPARKKKCKARRPSAYPSNQRRPSMGIDRGQSSHIGRRTSESRKPSAAGFGTWSGRLSRKHQHQHHQHRAVEGRDEYDERAPLLLRNEQQQRLDDFGSSCAGFDGQSARDGCDVGLGSGSGSRSRKMGVQDFVWMIEGMSRG